jgi:thiol-disulfide isomerase/thioredoxin
MMNLRIWLAVSLLALSSLVQAQVVTPFVKGSFADIQQQYKGQPYLVLFWGQDCAYCMKELASLAPLLKANPEVTLVTVATDPFLDETFIREKMAEFDLDQAENWVFADEYPETLYFDVNKRWRGELPLTYLSNGETLIHKSGLLKETDISAWLASLK